VQQLESPGDDPREYVALRHNLRQAQRELEAAQERGRREVESIRLAGEERLAAALAQQRQIYERSLSWRSTRPLRSAAKLARDHRNRHGRGGWGGKGG
jgi:hypothetical protein